MLRGPARWVVRRWMVNTTTTFNTTTLLAPLPPPAVTRGCLLMRPPTLDTCRLLCSVVATGADNQTSTEDSAKPTTEATKEAPSTTTITSEKEVTACLNRITETLNCNPKLNPKHRLSNLPKIFKILLALEISPQTIADQLTETPDLLDHTPKAWRETSSVLADHELPGLKILQSVAMVPDILSVRPETLNQTLTTYRFMSVGRQSVVRHVGRNPMLCLTNPKKVKRKLLTLSQMFPPTEFKLLLKKNPNVLTDPFDDTMAKILYVHEVMGLEQPHIASSRCLRQPLAHLRARHTFLVRAGLYRKPNLLKDKQSHRRNPSLEMIMDTSDRHFANRVARLSTEEYDVFKRMMEEEEEEEGEGEEEEEEAEEEEEEENLRKRGYKRYR
ncbi:transcription termination factor 4, mitochondrial-like isoform X2 [Eriocheir sinensis]|nr:transcription termination factor 4, mitochondrial-like isoform X2 [Eriocheir sinensis]